MSKKKQVTTEQEDIAAIVRVCRVANVLAFADRVYADAITLPTHICQRQKSQSTFMLGEVLYEAYHLAEETMDVYASYRCFAGLYEFIEKCRPSKYLLAEMNFSPAVTLDFMGTGTERELEELGVDLYSIAANCQRSGQGHVYFPATYDLDIQWLIEHRPEGMGYEDVKEFIQRGMFDLVELYLRGAVHFAAGMCRKIELARMQQRSERGH